MKPWIIVVRLSDNRIMRCENQSGYFSNTRYPTNRYEQHKVRATTESIAKERVVNIRAALGQETVE